MKIIVVHSQSTTRPAPRRHTLLRKFFMIFRFLRIFCSITLSHWSYWHVPPTPHEPQTHLEVIWSRTQTCTRPPPQCRCIALWFNLNLVSYEPIGGLVWYKSILRVVLNRLVATSSKEQVGFIWKEQLGSLVSRLQIGSFVLLKSIRSLISHRPIGGLIIIQSDNTRRNHHENLSLFIFSPHSPCFKSLCVQEHTEVDDKPVNASGRPINLIWSCLKIPICL